MEPFNICIATQPLPKTLTIHPEPESASYKVLYQGALLGALRQQKDCWAAVGQEKVEPGSFLLYNQKFGAERADIDLDYSTVSLIAAEIAEHLELHLYDHGHSIH